MNILEVKEINNLRNEPHGPLVLLQANLRARPSNETVSFQIKPKPIDEFFILRTTWLLP